jgi:hypothetical protein
MKRFSWLLLAVFCLALVQVQSVELPGVKPPACACCDVPGTCGLPDCGLPPAQAIPSCAVTQTLSLTRPTLQVESRLPRPPRAKFFAQYVVPAAAPTGVSGAAWSLPVPPVPLFTAHCSYLI